MEQIRDLQVAEKESLAEISSPVPSETPSSLGKHQLARSEEQERKLVR
jgi:hypothetical protein